MLKSVKGYSLTLVNSYLFLVDTDQASYLNADIKHRCFIFQWGSIYRCFIFQCRTIYRCFISQCGSIYRCFISKCRSIYRCFISMRIYTQMLHISMRIYSEFEITVCGSCKMSKKLNWPFLIFYLFNCFAKILNHFSTPLHSKKINYIFANVWKLFQTNLRVGNS